MEPGCFHREREDVGNDAANFAHGDAHGGSQFGTSLLGPGLGSWSRVGSSALLPVGAQARAKYSVWGLAGKFHGAWYPNLTVLGIQI